MNILYFCNVHRSIPTELGVLKKVYAQCSVLRDAGHTVVLACPDDLHTFVFTNEKNEIINKFSLSNVSRFKKSQKVLACVFDFIKENKIEFVYSRYSDFSLSAHTFYKKLRRFNVISVLEIPTYPINQRWTSIKQNFRNGNVKAALSQTYTSTVGSLGIWFFKNSLSRIVNNNGFDTIWGLKVIGITNGIDVKSIPMRIHTYKNKPELHLMSVANVAHWHGYDRIIRGLAEYYKNQVGIIVYFDLAGPGTEVELLKQLAFKLGVENYVNFKGVVVGKDLDQLFNHADIGISVLGVHRNNMTVYDSLKSREFCARRLPFITESAETHFQGKPFVLCAESNEEPIDILSIIDFYNRIVETPQILDMMYEFAHKECDWSKAFSPVVEYIDSLGNERCR